jgi:hypothetical protein
MVNAEEHPPTPLHLGKRRPVIKPVGIEKALSLDTRKVQLVHQKDLETRMVIRDQSETIRVLTDEVSWGNSSA